MAAFEGHDALSTSKAIYDDPTSVAPADRVYAEDPATPYDPADYTSEPGAPARANGYPRAD